VFAKKSNRFGFKRTKAFFERKKIRQKTLNNNLLESLQHLKQCLKRQIDNKSTILYDATTEVQQDCGQMDNKVQIEGKQ
jgi:hypothetical protein